MFLSPLPVPEGSRNLETSHADVELEVTVEQKPESEKPDAAPSDLIAMAAPSQERVNGPHEVLDSSASADDGSMPISQECITKPNYLSWPKKARLL